MNMFNEQNVAWNKSQLPKMYIHSFEFQEQATVIYCNKLQNSN